MSEEARSLASADVTDAATWWCERETGVVNAEIMVGVSMSDPVPGAVAVVDVGFVVIDDEGDVDRGGREPETDVGAGDCGEETDGRRDGFCPKNDAKGIEMRDGACGAATRVFGRGGSGGFGGFDGIGKDATYSRIVNVGYDVSGE